MESKLRLTTPDHVRARIAGLIIGDALNERTIGSISLEPHQLSAVARLQSALDEFGGALLCDEVGMGKTFVATGVARHYSRPLVVAPAALAEMWRESLALTAISADFVSFEKLSRFCSDRSGCSVQSVGAELSRVDHDLVIVDEAHHARNPKTRRYLQLQRLARNAKVLLLTATPIHNRLKEMSALLALFLGSRAKYLTASELARCIIRREHSQLQTGAPIPAVLPLITLQIADDPEIVRRLLSLPPPIPVRGGGLAAALIGRGLVHQWASSEAALHNAVLKRIGRSAALVASLEAGVYPTHQELESWTFADGALQLGFAELLAPPIADTSKLLTCVTRHSNALSEFRASHSARSALDDQRTEALSQIRARHPGAKIVAFAQYAKTVSMLYRKLANTGGIAMLTAQGAHVSGGKLSRQETLSRFAPHGFRTAPPPRAERIDLLLTTDLLSEGVNLQDAEVVVHLDVPWTSARMEQRIGRVARMGSTHSSVQPYLLRPPLTASELLDNELVVYRKWHLARQVLGSASKPPVPDATGDPGDLANESVSQKTEKLRSILHGWAKPHETSDETLAAAVASEQSGFVAAVSQAGRLELVVALSDSISADLDWQIDGCRLGGGRDFHSSTEEYQIALDQLRLWIESESASMLAGNADSSVARRRRLLNRIDSAIETGAPHFRSARLAAAALARQVVTSPHSAQVEAELNSLVHSPIPDSEWLNAISQVDTRPVATKSRGNSSSSEIRALLLLRKATPDDDLTDCR